MNKSNGKMKREKYTKAKKVEGKKLKSSGWNTTDGDEIERRRVRAEIESCIVEPMKKTNPYYSSFTVHSVSSIKNYHTKYRAEIRSLVERKNSCDCMDFKTNGLGTCKHIEKVLCHLKSKGKWKFQQAAERGCPWNEVYLHTVDGEKQIRVNYANTKNTAAFRLLNNFFSSDNSLLGDPVKQFPALIQKIQSSHAETQKSIRVSSHIDEWVHQLKEEKQRKKLQDVFTADVEKGKRSLDILKYPLYPYQRDGMLHLALKRRALLADEMGLGKTVQAIAACKLLQEIKGVQRVLVIATASLKAEWEEQIAKFSDLKTIVIQGPRRERLKLYQTPSFFYLTNYEQIMSDGADIQRLVQPDIIILDEAQRIKNWRTKTAAAVKKLKSPYAFVLTGTPLENRVDDIYSIVQFLDPYLLGPLFRFNREFYQLDENGHAIGYKNLDELHRRLRTILLRRQKSDIEDQLPERTVNHFFVEMDEEQACRYEDYDRKVARLVAQSKRRPLRKEEFEMLQRWLACMRMLCDTPYILDKECRISPKLRELEKIFDEILEDPTAKILIFSEWVRMLELVRDLADELKLGYAWHTGSVPQKKRRLEIKRFKEDPNCRLFLSSDSGSVGLNLQTANIVINMDLPWNPAKLEQRIARAWRKHQKRSVKIINLICENSIEHRMISLLNQKQNIAQNVLHDGKIKEMALPSGRAAFLDQLQTLMAMPQQLSAEPASSVAAEKDEQDEKALIEQLKTEMIEYCQNELVSVGNYTNPDGMSPIIAVVKNRDRQIDDFGKKQLQAKKLEHSHTIEILDAETLAVLNRLSKQGLITINPSAEKLFEPSETAETRKLKQEKRIRKTREQLAEAERKHSMAKLLQEGGFIAEAVQPLISAAKTALIGYIEVFNPLNSDEKQTLTSLTVLKRYLEKQSDFPNELFENIVSIEKDENNPDNAKVQKWVHAAAEIFTFIHETLNKMVLS